MSDHPGDSVAGDAVAFDEILTLALARAVEEVAPRPEVKERLMARLFGSPQQVPTGFSFLLDRDAEWLPHRCLAFECGSWP